MRSRKELVLWFWNMVLVLVVVSGHGPSTSDVVRVDMSLGAGLFPCLSVSTITVFSFSAVPYPDQRGDGECVEHDILSYS